MEEEIEGGTMSVQGRHSKHMVLGKITMERFSRAGELVALAAKNSEWGV